jgi:hypothetical protein
MYLSGTLIWLGWTIFCGSAAVLAATVIIWGTVTMLVVPWEERNLEARLARRICDTSTACHGGWAGGAADAQVIFDSDAAVVATGFKSAGADTPHATTRSGRGCGLSRCRALWDRPRLGAHHAGPSDRKLRNTPVIPIAEGGRQWLVAAYGEVSWVRNARAAGQVQLSRGRTKKICSIRQASALEAGRYSSSTSALPAPPDRTLPPP